MSATKGTNNGFGSPSIEIPVRLWECISVIVLALVLEHSGNLCHPSIVSARSVTAISGRLTKRCCLASVTERLAKIVVKPITLSGLTAHCGSESQGWYARPYPSPKSSKITLAQSGISFITTMHPYGFRTTPILKADVCSHIECRDFQIDVAFCVQELISLNDVEYFDLRTIRKMMSQVKILPYVVCTHQKVC